MIKSPDDYCKAVRSPESNAFVPVMPQIDLPQLVHDCLIETYVKVRGVAPEGGFYPNDRVQLTLRETYKSDMESLVGFLRCAMFAHMSRTEITKTPFFVNSHLLAESSIQYMEKHAGYLKSFYGNGSEPRVFEQLVFGSVLATEIDFLDTMGNYYLRSGQLPKYDILRPTVWWMIWCDTLGRLRMKDFPESWLTQKLMHRGNRTPAAQLVSAERAKLSDRHRFSVAEMAAGNAIREAAMTWSARHRAVRILYDNGVGSVAHDSAIDGALLESNHQLASRDLALFAAVRDGEPHRRQPVKDQAVALEAKHKPIYDNPKALAKLVREAAVTDDA